MNRKLIERTEKYQSDLRKLQEKAMPLRNEAKAELERMGWDSSSSNWEYFKNKLVAPPEADWRKTLGINFEPIEIRKIDESFYKRDQVGDYRWNGFRRKASRSGQMFALIREIYLGDAAWRSSDIIKIDDLEFRGAIINFNPRSDKVLVKKGDYDSYDYRFPGKEALLKVFNETVEKFNQDIRDNAGLYLTSKDPYKRHIANQVLEDDDE